MKLAGSDAFMYPLSKKQAVRKPLFIRLFRKVKRFYLSKRHDHAPLQ